MFSDRFLYYKVYLGKGLMLNSLANSVSYLRSFILSIKSSIRVNTVKEAPGPSCPISLSAVDSFRLPFTPESDLRVDFSICTSFIVS